jgi:hypothetical protein
MQRSMTAIVSAVLFSALLGAGCQADCGPASQLDESLFRTFGNLVSHRTVNDEAYPAEGSPANGLSDWQFIWGDVTSGRISVEIDGQAFDADGNWDEVECGHFTVAGSGTYVSESFASEHTFEFDGDFTSYEGRLEGIVVWAESWDTADENGRMTGRSQLRGTEYER